MNNTNIIKFNKSIQYCVFEFKINCLFNQILLTEQSNLDILKNLLPEINNVIGIVDFDSPIKLKITYEGWLSGQDIGIYEDILKMVVYKWVNEITGYSLSDELLK